MLHFEEPLYFYLLLCIPILFALFYVATLHNDKLRKQFGDLINLNRLTSDISRLKRPLKFSLLMMAFTFLTIALANPRVGHRTQSVKGEGADVYIAIDVSKSMWAQDVKPNRMERARQFSQKLIDAIEGDRVGLIFFAGSPFLQMPLTTDYAAARLFVQNASPELNINQGTAIEKAIDRVVELGRKNKKKKQRALIVITDGENHQTDAASAAQIAKAEGVATFVVAVGTEAGAPIPVQKEGRTEFKLDAKGQVVHSKMNADMLRNIATSGGGKFYKIKPDADAVIYDLVKKISGLEKSEFMQKNFDVFETYFQYFVALALLLLFMEFFISYRKSNWLKE